MSRKYWFLLLVVLSLLSLIVLPACGSSKTSTLTPTATTGPSSAPTSTPTATLTPTATPAPTSSGPVKIGVIVAWSGPSAAAGTLADQTINLVQDQVKQMGGILGGRLVQFVKSDDGSKVTGSGSAALALVTRDKVSFVTCGGESAPGIAAASAVTENAKVPFIGFATIGTTADMAKLKYSACLYGSESIDGRIANFLINYLKPKTVGFLCYDSVDARQVVDGEPGNNSEPGVVGVKDRLAAAGIKIVQENWFPVDTTDFTSYLTKLKYANPDVAVIRTSGDDQGLTIIKEITDLGGWGSMKVYAEQFLVGMYLPGAVGTYTSTQWIPGSDDPGMKAFEDAWNGKYNSTPNPSITYYYNCFWTAIKAIQLVGTDNSEQIAQVLRSGKLEWDSAWGHMVIPTSGIGQVDMMVAKILKGGKLVEVYPKDYSQGSTGTPEPTATVPGGATHTGLDINSTIGALVANPDTAAVIDHCIPGEAEKPELAQAYGFTFGFIAPYDTTTFTPEVMKCLTDGLAAIK